MKWIERLRYILLATTYAIQTETKPASGKRPYQIINRSTTQLNFLAFWTFFVPPPCLNKNWSNTDHELNCSAVYTNTFSNFEHATALTIEIFLKNFQPLLM